MRTFSYAIQLPESTTQSQRLTPPNSSSSSYNTPVCSHPVSHLKCARSRGPQTDPAVRLDLAEKRRSGTTGGEWESERGRHAESSAEPFSGPSFPAKSCDFPADTMGCCSGRCTLIFICTLQLVSWIILIVRLFQICECLFRLKALVF